MYETVQQITAVIGGPEAFERYFGELPLRRGNTPYRAQADHTGILVTTAEISIDGWTIVHELGHVWDARYNWRLSQTLEKFTGGNTSQLLGMAQQHLKRCDAEARLPGCNNAGYYYNGPPPAGSDKYFNRVEDFAEAFAAYIYPDIAQSRVVRFRDDPTYAPLLYYTDYKQTQRWAFIHSLFHGTLLKDYRLTR